VLLPDKPPAAMPECCSVSPLGLLTALPPPLLLMGPLPTSASSPPPPPPPSPGAIGMRPPLLLLLARRIVRKPPALLPAALLLPPPLLLLPLVESVRPLQLLLRCAARAGLDTADVVVEVLSQLKVKLPSPVVDPRVEAPPACELPLAAAANRALKSAAAACAAAAAAAARGVPDCEEPDSCRVTAAPPPLLPVGVLGWLLPCTVAAAAAAAVAAPEAEVRPMGSMDERLEADVGEGSEVPEPPDMAPHSASWTVLRARSCSAAQHNTRSARHRDIMHQHSTSLAGHSLAGISATALLSDALHCMALPCPPLHSTIRHLPCTVTIHCYPPFYNPKNIKV
jgi:hypothetical protein